MSLMLVHILVLRMMMLIEFDDSSLSAVGQWVDDEDGSAASMIMMMCVVDFYCLLQSSHEYHC